MRLSLIFLVDVARSSPFHSCLVECRVPRFRAPYFATCGCDSEEASFSLIRDFCPVLLNEQNHFTAYNVHRRNADYVSVEPWETVSRLAAAGPLSSRISQLLPANDPVVQYFNRNQLLGGKSKGQEERKWRRPGGAVGGTGLSVKVAEVSERRADTLTQLMRSKQQIHTCTRRVERGRVYDQRLAGDAIFEDSRAAGTSLSDGISHVQLGPGGVVFLVNLDFVGIEIITYRTRTPTFCRPDIFSLFSHAFVLPQRSRLLRGSLDSAVVQSRLPGLQSASYAQRRIPCC